MRPMPSSISAPLTGTCELPSPDSRLDTPTSVMPTCVIDPQPALTTPIINPACMHDGLSQPAQSGHEPKQSVNSPGGV